MNFLEAMETEDTLTENGMRVHSKSNSACLDFFGSVGSARNWSDKQIINVFVHALEEDAGLAMRILFWARDARGGAGERKVFRTCINFLDNHSTYREYLYKNFFYIPFFGRWDDLFILNDPMVLGMIEEGLENKDGLLAKWLPRKGAFAETVRKHLGCTPKEYRQTIVGLSKTVEQLMCRKDWRAIRYEQVPSVAFHKYRKAFGRNDRVRFEKFILDAKSGKVPGPKAGVLFPYQLYQAYMKRENRDAIEAQWMNLPDYLKGNTERMIPVCDVSGSMWSGYGGNTTLTPMDISVSLGVYISERNVGPFKDAFITFSNRPTLQKLKGSICDRFDQLRTASWQMNTDLEAVFKLILTQATKHKVPVSEMPTQILILSDMQFDECVKDPDNTAMKMIKRMYNEVGYEVPKVVFWNLNARVGQSPVKFDEKGTALVSGASPAILKSVLSGKWVTPHDLMMETVNADRYQVITV